MKVARFVQGAILIFSVEVGASRLTAQTSGGALYHFDEGAGTTALDSSGAGNHAQISGATYVDPGQHGTGLRFGSPTDTVLLPQSIFAGFGNSAYFEAWIRPTDRSTCGGDRTVFRKRTNTGWEWLMYLGNAGDGFNCSLYIPDTVGISAQGGTLPLNQWSKVACNYDGSSLRILLNDVEVGRQDGVFSIDWNAGYIKTEIGNDTLDTGRNCGDYSFHGDIDEVRISTAMCIYGPPDPPLIFRRGHGKPQPESVSWASCGGSGQIEIASDDVSSAVMFLNGSPLDIPNNLKKSTQPAVISIDLVAGINTLTVELRGKPGSTATILISR